MLKVLVPHELTRKTIHKPNFQLRNFADRNKIDPILEHKRQMKTVVFKVQRAGTNGLRNPVDGQEGSFVYQMH